ncbi:MULTISPECIES: ADP-ribosylglycohydrolase family protein [Glycomyces]|uniref:ADP-ribosylglycohydrolase family protein n=2 Tax=Glycomyces TaxID=58113 RepID=A0A9X3ST23_9ACTN|nr:ADP-ribosylglycohydrolase family protein [Glycomyces lechevalierae]MDA1383474.1 ADP-ribosylglycohydrolase family protein [Glycomyces lechevalierae]MDR7336480.1 poly(ADP-ribose) glycohydrolase ARH3 [Glycomyces lechevalierae]
MTEKRNGMAASLSWRSRARGSLLLAACADAIGSVFEGHRGLDPEAVAAAVDRPKVPLQWTDDTAQMLVLAEHLAAQEGRIDMDALAAAFGAAWAAEPSRGYGPGAVTMLAQIAAGTPWQSAARAVFDGAGSLGNGAAMRVAPIGLLPGRNLDDVAAAAVTSALVSHVHPEGIDGAVAQALAVAIAANTPGTERPQANEFIEQITARTATAAFAADLQAVPSLIDGPASAIGERFRCDATALGAVPASIAVFLRHPDDPRAAIKEAIGLGGDTDTIAAMTAGICGAYCGEDAVPASWTAVLEQAARVLAAADGIAGP